MFSNRYMQLPSHFYSEVRPEVMEGAQLVYVNRALQLDLALPLTDDEILGLLSGEVLQAGMLPIAHKYTGHQFGYYNPDLGDGRGMLLGQFCVPENNQAWSNLASNTWDFHLKGAGRTPFSRRGDGRAVLRSSIRELLASEALFGLRVPTTRALGLATSFNPTERVWRETSEPRATILRLTPSHIRFGHFEWAASRGKADL
jgi:serine/tyrosine/threonine adenylyltransferase